MNIEEQYLLLLDKVIKVGHIKGDRTGTGTRSLFGEYLTHDMRKGFPLLTTKKLSFHNIKHELLWFLSGSTSIKYLVDNNVNIWNDDAYRGYREWFEREPRHSYDVMASKEEFVELIKTDPIFRSAFGDLGPTYGYQWRSFSTFPSIGDNVDQIDNVINLLKTNPDSRRILCTAWNPSETDEVTLPPCHILFQCWTRELNSYERENIYASRNNYSQQERYEMNPNASDEDVHKIMDEDNIPRREISLVWHQRSADLFLGLPYNIASYALLLRMLADEVNMEPGELKVSIGDAHIYSNHIDQVKEQLSRDPYKLPKLNPTRGIQSIADDLTVSNYISYPAIKAPLSVG